MIDHVDLRVSDIDASRAFYEAALRPLGFAVESESPDPNGGREIGFGGGDGVEFAIHEPTSGAGQDTVTVGAHIAFAAAGPEAVAEFHRAGLQAGGRDLGAPGLRRVYREGYYGAFLLDPDGNNVEAVCYLPAGACDPAAGD